VISVTRPGPENEPEDFESNCREPGRLWLQAHPQNDPHQQNDWWTQFQPDLARLFSYRCGWLATSIDLQGVVDHWAPVIRHRELAFEWSNYRYCSGTINSLKSAHTDILDPCEVREGWFELQLPSFLLIATSHIPEYARERAQKTLEKLQLQGHRARWTRWHWYRRYYQESFIDLDGLERDAPLIALAVRKAQANGDPLPDPKISEPALQRSLRRRPYRPRP
jgi:hypothetical protein